MKALQYIVEGFAALLLGLFLGTQILMPALMGTKLFPFFRRQQRIKQAIYDEQELQREQQLASELETRREATNQEQNKP